MATGELRSVTAPAMPAAVPTSPGAPSAGQCHTWLVPVRRAGRWIDLLDPEERRRAAAISAPAARDTFITSRAAQRRVGARYLGVSPTEVVIRRDCAYCGALHGRPRLVGANIDYSVSHTRDWVLLAVVGSGLVGADIEGRSAKRDTDGLATVALTTSEHDAFARLPAAQRPDWFLRAWTRKEAAMKLTGFGLRAEPGQLDVSGPLLTVGRVPGWPDVSIYLYDLPAPPSHVAALASSTPMRDLCSFTLPDGPG